MTPVIAIKELSKKYGSLTALQDVSFTVDAGERVALLGANGAGKSTLFNILLGFLPATRGSSSILSAPSAEITPLIKARFAYISEEPALPPWSKPAALMELFKSLYPKWDAGCMARFIETWRIDVTKPCASMSKGQRRLAEIALFLSAGPELLLLDEPFDGLDALMRLTVIQTLLDIHKEKGITLLFSSHIVSEAPKLSDRILILKEGRLAFDSPLASLKKPLEQEFLAAHDTANRVA